MAYTVPISTRKNKNPRLKIGDLVRISKAKNIFEQGYKSNWTKEIFVSDKVLKKTLTEYNLHDLKGEKILGIFLDIELQKIIVKSQKKKGSKKESIQTESLRPQRASKIKGRQLIHQWTHG